MVFPEVFFLLLHESFIRLLQPFLILNRIFLPAIHKVAVS